MPVGVEAKEEFEDCHGVELGFQKTLLSQAVPGLHSEDHNRAPVRCLYCGRRLRRRRLGVMTAK
eukprot:6256212-Ditylum_brightwellii.AAC.1